MIYDFPTGEPEYGDCLEPWNDQKRALGSRNNISEITVKMHGERVTAVKAR